MMWERESKPLNPMMIGMRERDKILKKKKGGEREREREREREQTYESKEVFCVPAGVSISWTGSMVGSWERET